MESVNVVVMITIADKTLVDECLRRIRAVSDRVKVVDASALSLAEYKGDTAAGKKLAPVLARADIVFGYVPPGDLAVRAPGLKWFQTASAGVDRFVNRFGNSQVVLTNLSGIGSIPISEFVLAMMLMLAKQAPLLFEAKKKKEWSRLTPALLHSRTVGIVGLGHIGREVARLCRAFGMKVTAVRRTAREAGRARNVDLLLPASRLLQLLSESDFVVLTLPLTPETRGLIGEKELRTMKTSACLINVGRGGIVDEQALVRALEEQWIAGAGLDVFATEPLPAGSRLWDLPNVVLSPHISAWTEGYFDRATDLFCENLRRYLDGRRLLNVVDKKAGY